MGCSFLHHAGRHSCMTYNIKDVGITENQVKNLHKSHHIKCQIQTFHVMTDQGPAKTGKGSREVHIGYLHMKLWCGDLGWMTGSHQNCSTSSLSWTRERKYNQTFLGQDRDREASFTNYHHRQTRLYLGNINLLPSESE